MRERQPQSSYKDVRQSTLRFSLALLGTICSDTNEYEKGLEFRLDWLKLLKERSEQTPDYELGYAYSEIGIAYGDLGRFDEAIQSLQKSIEVYQSLPEYKEHWLTPPRTNLGFLYCLQTKFKEAELILLQALHAQELAFGKDDMCSFRQASSLFFHDNCNLTMIEMAYCCMR